jgi:acyl-CoA synthetase (AMP-forming)/AMP-acid ligase II
MSAGRSSPNTQGIYRGPWPDIDIPDMPLGTFVLQRAHEHPDKAALIDGPSGRTLTYRQLADGSRRAAVGLSRRGFGKGDVFAICSPNLPEFAVAFHGVAALGGIVTPINPLATATELAHQLNDSGAAYLVTTPPFTEKALEAAGKSKVREVFVFGEAAGATAFADLLADDGPLPEVRIDAREDLVALPYSSGTTGLPKGVMLTHANLVSNLCQMDGAEPLSQDDVVIAVLPFFHIMGLMVVLNRGLSKGATIVTLPRFELEPFLEVMQRYGVTRAYLVPPIVLALAKHPLVERYDLSKLQTIVSGAAPLSAELADACAARLGCQVKQGYGLTETSPVTHVAPDERNKPGSIGPGLRNTEYKVVDIETGAALGPGRQGELCVRGPQVMRGYLNQPAATVQTVDADGWLHTGDIASIDADGYVYIVDRIKELIKYKGYQVAPAALEAVLATHPAIADAAVIGCPDEEAGEIPKAFVVLKAHATAEQILAYAAERLAPYERIRRLEVVDQIPKSASGKILRRVLIQAERERAQAGTG